MPAKSAFPHLAGERWYPLRQLPLSVICDHSSNGARHSHDFIEIVLVSRGRGTHVRFPPKAKAGAVARYEIVENDVFLIAPGWSHSYEDRREMQIYNLIFSPTLLTDEPAWPKSGTDDLLHLFAGGQPGKGATSLIHKLHLRRSEREAMEGILRDIMQELTSRRPGFELLAKARLLETLVLLDRAHLARSRDYASFTRGPSARTGSAVVDAIAFMEENFVTEIGLTETAHAAALSPHYFCEVFKEATGETPGHYLTRLRLEHAKHLLLTTADNVTEVAMRSGFGDSAYFARAFKAAFGATPREFRQAGKLP